MPRPDRYPEARNDLGGRGGQVPELPPAVGVAMVLIVVALFTYLYFDTRYNPSHHLSNVSRVRSDSRSLATAVESYRVDYGVYPPHAFLPTVSADGASNIPASWPNSSTWRAAGIGSLTTPIAYVGSYYADPFASVPGTPLRYQRRGNGWIIGSFGPDKDQATGGDLRWDRPILVYNPAIVPLDPKFVGGPWTYDPSNGTVSEGDLWRVKQ